MIAGITKHFLYKNRHLNSVARMLLFGLLSFSLGQIEFSLPNVVGGMSDFREVALLLSVLYFPHWGYLIGVCMITSLGSLGGGFNLVLSSFLMHSFSIIVFWVLIKTVRKNFNSNLTGFYWLACVLAYYLILLFPTLALTRLVFQHITLDQLLPTYRAILQGGRFELISTTAIVSLWASLYHIHETLLFKNVELIDTKRHAEKSNQLKSAFLQNLSHEIRTPLNAIIGFTELLFDDTIDPEEKKNYKLVIENNSNNLLRLVEKTLVISRIDTGEINTNPFWINLDDLCQELKKFTIKEKTALEKHTLDFSMKQSPDTQGIEIFTDGSMLKNILINLLQNAVNFTHSGRISLKISGKDNRIIFVISDTGIGISRKDQKLVFERFYKADQAGSNVRGIGLGLTIVEKMVQILGGEIALKSFENVGTTIHISLPSKIRKLENTVKPNPEKLFHNIEKLDGNLILVAEDDDFNYLYIEKVLQKASYKVIRAFNGLEAISMVQNNHISLVLMDLKMPLMDGLSATKEIRSQFPNLPIVAQTGQAFEEDKEAALKAGCIDFIAKPIKRKQLLTIIEGLV